MNMKHFPFLLHVILAAVAIGFAAGCATEHVRPMIQYPVTGLAAALGFTAFIRLMF